ncbi:Transmembrane channel-like protein 3 [Merluccius polli]|uniref:Transmembrane channel-like protein 3 n=1 Tax=Merluccius polli TaxID=89951 RepID=A0AA47MM25_MERPO|nr:Transmembrane channel-like protein 3 [Merluccius polli]
MLLFMLFLCMLPTIFAIVRYRPSQHCGPFSGQEKIYDIISDTIASDFPVWFNKVMIYITSPVVVLPALLLLFMLIYYLQAIARSLKFTNNQLRQQLQTERSDDKKKVFQLAAARLQAPEVAVDKKTDQQESDVTSHESSIHSSSPQHNGSVTSFQSPVRRGNSIRTITQSVSRADLNTGSAAGSSKSPPVSMLHKQRLEHMPTRQQSAPFLIGPNSSCRAKSYRQVAYNPAPCFPDDVHYSEPLYRKTARPLHPAEATGIITAHSYVGRRPHVATRYVILNEHEARKKLLRSTTRIPRHYCAHDGPSDPSAGALGPRSGKRYPPRTPHHPLQSQRSLVSQPHLSEEEEEEEEGVVAEGRKKGPRRGSFGQDGRRPRSLSDLYRPARFYIGERVESQVLVGKDAHVARGRRGGVVQDGADAREEEDEIDWDGLEAYACSHTHGGRRAEPVVQTKRPTQSPGRYGQPSSVARLVEAQVKPKTRSKLEPSLTESDSASLGSSSDQQNSSTDQYIQVIHNKERYLKSDARQGKLAKKKSKASIDLNVSRSNEMVCSNV